MGAWVRVDRRRVIAVAAGLAGIGVGVLAHPGSARTRASSRPANEGGCVIEASVTTRPRCLRAGLLHARRVTASRPRLTRTAGR